MLYSHEIRVQYNLLEPEEPTYLLILERFNDLNRNDFLHVMPIELEENKKRRLCEWIGIEGIHFATALPGKGFCRRLQ